MPEHSRNYPLEIFRPVGNKAFPFNWLSEDMALPARIFGMLFLLTIYLIAKQE